MSFETVVLGPEYDELLRRILREALLELGAQSVRHDWGLGGSQELETLEVEIDGHPLRVEAETYMGVSLTGPPDLVRKVQRIVNERRAAAVSP